MPFRKTQDIVEALTREMSTGSPASGILPSLSVLAGRFGTSRLTLRRVLNRLEADGLVERREGFGGYRVAGRGVPAAETLSLEADFERLSHRIRGEVLQYRSPSGSPPLPSRKEMAARFGCSLALVGRALDHLVATGALERRGRRFFLPRASPGSRSSSAVYVCGSPSVLDQGSLVHDCLREIERTVYEQGWSGIRLLLTSRPADEAPPAREEVAGYIVLSRTKGWWTFLSRQPEIPSVYVDTVGDTYWPKGAPGRQAFHIAADNTAAGSGIARHLARNGHRNIAYINPIGGEYEWDRLRIDGLRQYFSVGNTQAGLGRMRILSASKPGRANPPDANVLSQSSSRIRAIARTIPFLTPELIATKLWGLANLLQAQVIGGRAWPLFEDAFANPGITAWVCANDLTAALAAAFLRSRQPSAGGRISCVSFDNSDLAYRHHLTSWDFALPRMGRLAVQCLVRPSQFGRRMPVVTRVEGTLIERESSNRL